MKVYYWMLPIFLAANLHCFGMCGPLAAFLAQHRWKSLYFFGRIVSFTLAGLLSGTLGMAFSYVTKDLGLEVFTCSLLALFFIALSLNELGILPSIMPKAWQSWAARCSLKLSLFLNRPSPWPPFAFGLATILLPCAQSLMIFSSLALQADVASAGLNAFIFAVCTSPSLLVAQLLSQSIKKIGLWSRRLMAAFSLFLAASMVWRLMLILY